MLTDTKRKMPLPEMNDVTRDELDNMTPKRALLYVKSCLADNPAIRNIRIGDGKVVMTLAEIIDAALSN